MHSLVIFVKSDISATLKKTQLKRTKIKPMNVRSKRTVFDISIFIRIIVLAIHKLSIISKVF